MDMQHLDPQKKIGLIIVLTGRDAHPEVTERANTVTEMAEVKHAYREGIEAQQGIDY